MPELLGCSYELTSVRFAEFVDHSESAKKPGNLVPGAIAGQFDWDSHPAKETLTLTLRTTLFIQPSKQLVLRVVLKAEFKVKGYVLKKEYGNTFGFPLAVWIAMGREAWAILEAKIKAQPTPIMNVNIPPPTNEQIAPSNSFGGFMLN